jgi:hypothetical protein
MEWKLTSTNFCSCNHLTWIPKGNHSRMKKKGECESSFTCKAFVVKMSQSQYEWRGRGYLYSLSQKLAVGERVPEYSRYMFGYSGLWEIYGPGTVIRRLQVYVRILRTLCPDILDRSLWTQQGHSQEYHFKVVFVAHKYLYGFSWAQLPCQHL